MRFIPAFQTPSQKKSAVPKKAMGLYSSKGIVDRVRGACRVFVSMIAWSLESSMRNRYVNESAGQRTFGQNPFFVVSFFIRVTVFCLRQRYALSGFPSSARRSVRLISTIIPKSRKNSAFAAFRRRLHRFAALSLIPFAVEIKEAIVWKYSVSKI